MRVNLLTASIAVMITAGTVQAVDLLPVWIFHPGRHHIGIAEVEGVFQIVQRNQQPGACCRTTVVIAIGLPEQFVEPAPVDFLARRTSG